MIFKEILLDASDGVHKTGICQYSSKNVNIYVAKAQCVCDAHTADGQSGLYLSLSFRSTTNKQ